MIYPTTLRVAVLLAFLTAFSHAQSYKYFRLGSPQDLQTHPTFGIAMMGGGTDLDEAFRWLCNLGSGGDFLVLRARGDDDYNSYVNGLCKANSVSTLILPDQNAANDPKVAEIVRNAEVIFIAGGDQANYLRGWRGTELRKALNDGIAAGKPIGGTSAGLAVLGEFVYGALGDKPDDKDLSSPQVLANPYFDRVTVVRDFLKIPILADTITDSHFAKRDRMGRSLGFLARIVKDGWNPSPREIAIDERSAVLVDKDGKSTVVGTGTGAYFMKVTQAPEQCEPNLPLTIKAIRVDHVHAGGHFDLTTWSGDGGKAYALSVIDGKIESTQPGNSIY